MSINTDIKIVSWEFVKKSVLNNLCLYMGVFFKKGKHNTHTPPPKKTKKTPNKIK